MTGNQVKLARNDSGETVDIIYTNSYPFGYSAEEWTYLNTGLLILAKDSSLTEPSEDIELTARNM